MTRVWDRAALAEQKRNRQHSDAWPCLPVPEQWAWGRVGSLPGFAQYPFTEIAQKGTGMLPACLLVGTKEENQFIAEMESAHFNHFKVIEMGKNGSAGHQVGFISGQRCPKDPPG